MRGGALWRVRAPYYCAGFILSEEGSRIIYAAPIIKWMIGKTLPEARAYCARRKFQCEEVK